jgi:hypothetical protein
VPEDPRTATAGELDGVIARARIDDDDLVGERDAREAIRKLPCRVSRDQGYGEGHDGQTRIISGLCAAF